MIATQPLSVFEVNKNIFPSPSNTLACLSQFEKVKTFRGLFGLSWVEQQLHGNSIQSRVR